MAAVVPIELARLRSATATYVAILYGSLPALEDLVAAEPGAELMAQLRDRVEAALDATDPPGTPGAILTTLCHLLGTEPLAAGAQAPAAPPSALPNASPPNEMRGVAEEGDGLVWRFGDEALMVCTEEVEMNDVRRIGTDRWAGGAGEDV